MKFLLTFHKIFCQNIYMECVKMSLFLSLFYVTILLLDKVSGEDITQKSIRKESSELMAEEEFHLLNPDMEAVLQKLEELGARADTLSRPDAYLSEDPQKIYDEMVNILDDVIESIKNSNNAYKFIKANGLDRIVQQNLKGDSDKLKTRIIILLKVLFEVAPTTTSAVIPITVVDRLLDVFERDNLALKAHVLDVLYLWLPDNPRVQARVMKVKGLVPFYDQLANLDASVIKTLLDLFNNIIKEHLRVRSDAQRTAVDSEKMKFYLRIGLLEHMSTPTVCNGLLNIFSRTLSYQNEDNNLIAVVFDMMNNIKEFCLKNYIGKAKATKLFTALHEYVNDPENIEYFESNGYNVTSITSIVQGYVDKLKHNIKDEM